MTTKHPCLWTVGHSRHSAEELIALLEGQGIACVVDVRSAPFSRRNPQHNKAALSGSLAARGIGYAWEGEALGGRPDLSAQPALCDEAGNPDWKKVRESPAFQEALERVYERAREGPTAVLCAEENPRSCHRLHLISAAWAERFGEDILHIRGGGRVETQKEAAPQPGLFDDQG